MPKVQLKSGINLHYQRIGQGPDLVLIHGLTGNLAVWHLKIAPLLRDHFRVVTYDLRGHGYSDMPPSGYTANDMATDLEQFLDALEIEAPYLVGHSYGADTILYFAHRHPERVRKAIVIEAGLAALIDQRIRADWEGWRYWAEALEHFGVPVPPEKRSDMDFLLRESLKIPKIYGPATGRPRKAEPLLKLLETTMVKDYEVVGDLTLENIARVQPEIFLIYGEGSAYLGTFEYLKQHLPHSKSTLLPTSNWGHFGPLEQPELLARYISEYCRDSETSLVGQPDRVADSPIPVPDRPL